LLKNSISFIKSLEVLLKQLFSEKYLFFTLFLTFSSSCLFKGFFVLSANSEAYSRLLVSSLLRTIFLQVTGTLTTAYVKEKKDSQPGKRKGMGPRDKED
jgi:ascorbate-specific PTS system EIIC-type component UlaA